jgi:nucleoid-associated protein Lsr2
MKGTHRNVSRAARRVVLIDHLDESEGAETITYAADGVSYEIDLSEENAKKFRSVLDPYITASRRVEAAPPEPVSIARASSRRRSSGSSGGSGGARSRQDLAEIRKWAQEQGMDVAARGRIKQEIIDKYDEAHTS